MKKFSFSNVGYLIAVIGLFFYSFTQVDLSLTLSQISIWQVFEKFFQHIGYFQRPLSGWLFIGTVSLLFIFYLAILRGVHKKKISRETIWFLIISTVVLLAFSYNAFSYDLFNYIFDAKIVTNYNLNPYTHKALDFPGDPMLSFMHSTHRPYPYGPVWILLTAPLSFLGFGFFLPTFLIFKTFIAASFLGSSYFLEKILKQVKIQDDLFALSFFALNPLVIVESLVSGHNDIVMIFLSLWSLYLIINKKYIGAFLLLVLSIGIKFATVILLPVFIYILVKQLKNNAIDFKKIFMIAFISMCSAVTITSFASGINKNPEIQPWYFLMVFPFAALVAHKRLIVFLSICISVGMLISYIPYLLMGEWPKDIAELKVKLLILSIGLGFFLYAIKRRFLIK
ncbi:MAG: hypothetical protein HYW62_04815 [Candidatus Levybacteria bacterium]|nr:hypothetical protein [Candidatus Levybacteria bacterium]